jgi:hypothetical protein
MEIKPMVHREKVLAEYIKELIHDTGKPKNKIEFAQRIFEDIDEVLAKLEKRFNELGMN